MSQEAVTSSHFSVRTSLRCPVKSLQSSAEGEGCFPRLNTHTAAQERRRHVQLFSLPQLPFLQNVPERSWLLLFCLGPCLQRVGERRPREAAWRPPRAWGTCGAGELLLFAACGMLSCSPGICALGEQSSLLPLLCQLEMSPSVAWCPLRACLSPAENPA